MTYAYITTQPALDALAAKITREAPENISVDTEFVRKTSYWPKLCLIQLCFLDKTYIVDALANLDLSPLKPAFQNPDICKIFHSGRQDIEILYRMWGSIPANIADTQILGMVTGFGDCASYEKICDTLLRKKLDKSQQHTDWGKRPLSQRQLDYAAADVRDLETVYEKLIKKANEKITYIKDELAWLTCADTYVTDVDAAWEKIKVRGPKKAQFWGHLQALARVRENTAIAEDKARGHIIKDDVLVQMAEKTVLSPKIISDMGVKSTSLAQALSEAFTHSQPLERDKPIKMSKSQDQLLDLMKLFLKVKADMLHLAPKLMGTKTQLVEFILDPASSPFLTGWRFELYGKTAVGLLEGKVALVCETSAKAPSIKFLNIDETPC